MPDKSYPGEGGDKPYLVMVFAVCLIDWQLMDFPKAVTCASDTRD
ncbi:hypothetical protein HORM4_930056 [Vibrio harveyi]|nr:hypothetical protein HORM4_930056 [Vibrio harveyi]